MKISSAWTPLLAGLVSFLLFLPFASIEIDSHHDGLMLKTAYDVASGQILFHDTFTQYGALTTYLHAGALIVFGKTLYSLRLFTVLIYALIAPVLILIWRKILAPPLVIAAFGLWLSFVPFFSFRWSMQPWSSVPALLFQCLTLFFLLRSFETKKTHAFSLLVGICAALVFWCRFPVGLFLSVAVLCVYSVRLIDPKLRTETLNHFAGFAFGYLLIMAAFFVHISNQNTIHSWYEQTIHGPHEWVARKGTSLFTLLRYMIFEPVSEKMEPIQRIQRWVLTLIFAFLSYLPIRFAQNEKTQTKKLKRLSITLVVSVLSLSCLNWELIRTIPVWGTLIPFYFLIFAISVLNEFWKNKKFPSKNDFSALVIAIISLASWAQYYPVPCARHIFWGLSPGIGLFIFIYYRWTRKNQTLTLLSLGILILPLIVSQISVGIRRVTSSLTRISAVPVLAGMKTSPARAQQFKLIYTTIAAYEKTHGPTPVLMDGADALWGTFSKDPINAGPHFVTLEGVILSEEELSLRDAFIRTRHPIIQIYDKKLDDVVFFQKNYGYAKAINYGRDFGVFLFKNNF